jgi:tRNA (guanine26-N2/guanine27-N2)-dimethyltransferase
LKTVETVEGSTRLIVPRVSLERAEPPTTPAFFNPAASTNRDISVALTEASTGTTFCDSLAGVGSRGIRIANEVRRRMNVTMVDFNTPSLRLARKSALLNKVGRKCKVVEAETNSFLYSRFRRNEKFDFVDVDPFGTPAPYIQAALTAVSDGGMLSFTATDTAVLCGVYPRVSLRRYGASTINNSFHHETAVRVLIGWCQRVAGAIDMGIAPVAAHVTKHYVRAFVRAEVGATKADAAMKSEGFVMQCASCGHAWADSEPTEVCNLCGKKARRAGPMWVGKLVDEALVRKASKVAEDRGFSVAAKTLTSLIGIDSFPPYSFSLERICSSLKVASVSPGRVAQNLKSSGFRCMGQPFEKTGMKSDCALSDMVAAVKAASGQGCVGSAVRIPFQPSQ